LQQKLVGLFRAIYDNDPDLPEIQKDAFECMKMQKIRGNICPLIKNAIQECIKSKKDGIEKLWSQNLVVTVDNKQQLKAVEENPKIYGRILLDLVNAYKLYDKSVDQIVEVWKEMLNSSKELKNTFYLLIMTEFAQTVWADENIRVIIDEIKDNQDKLQDYKETLVDFHEIDQKLNSSKLGAFISSTQQEAAENAGGCGEDYGHGTCERCHKPQLNKKKQKKKPCKSEGKPDPTLYHLLWAHFLDRTGLSDEVLNKCFIAGSKKAKNGKSKKNKNKKDSKG
jgi:hypothetical protein